MTMAQRIRECRKSFNMTQKELASKLGVKEAAVSKWESGKVENIPRTTIKMMSELFQVNPCYLMAFSNNSSMIHSEISIFDRVAMQYGTKTRDLLQEFTAMNDHGQQLALSMVRSLVHDPANTKQEKEALKNA